MAELSRGSSDLLDDEKFTIRILKEAAELAGAKFLSSTSHKFSPQGVTAVVLLAESHISIHTWPEHGYAAADCFTCGTGCDPEAAIRHIKDQFLFKEGRIKLFDRSLLQPAAV